MELNTYNRKLSDRELWAHHRALIENTKHKITVGGKKVRKNNWVDQFLPLFEIGLKITGQFNKGLEKAKDIAVKKYDLIFPDLPDAFQDYSILHLTDLHLDTIPDFASILINTIKKVNYDICLITGDYKKETEGPFEHILNPLEMILKNINARDGIYGVLGNHDTYKMVAPFEKLGMRFLLNEHISIERNRDQIQITGIDDPHHHYTNHALKAASDSNGAFKIMLAHSPEFCHIAENNQYRLYLCGHTHGGQVCLPGGKPVITQLINEKDKVYGHWKINRMKGYTSAGCGTSGIPVRFNSQSEITIFRLKSKY